MILVGAAGGQFMGAEGNQFLNNIWDISDTLNGLMALPNLIGLLILSLTLRKIVNDYDIKNGMDEDSVLTDSQRAFTSKMQYIAIGVLSVLVAVAASFTLTSVLSIAAVALGLVAIYKKQTLLGTIGIAIAIAAALV